MNSKTDEITRGPGRPRFVDENTTLQLRVPQKDVAIAEQLNIPYKRYLNEAFQKIVKAGASVPKGNTFEETFKNAVKRDKAIKEALKRWD